MRNRIRKKSTLALLQSDYIHNSLSKIACDDIKVIPE